jgi:hypothetical protein
MLSQVLILGVGRLFNKYFMFAGAGTGRHMIVGHWTVPTAHLAFSGNGTIQS